MASTLSSPYHDEHGRPLQATEAPQTTDRVAQHPKTITRGGMPYQPPRPITPKPAAPTTVTTPATDNPDLAAAKRSAVPEGSRHRPQAETRSPG